MQNNQNKVKKQIQSISYHSESNEGKKKKKKLEYHLSEKCSFIFLNKKKSIMKHESKLQTPKTHLKTYSKKQVYVAVYIKTHSSKWHQQPNPC